MSQSLKSNASLERLRAYVVGVTAALVALLRLRELGLPAMEALAGGWLEAQVEAWRGARGAIDEALRARDRDRDRELETTATVRVFDLAWDGTVRRLSSMAFLLADKDADREPYAQLFGTVKADDLTRLGPAKAKSAGAALALKAQAFGAAALDPIAAAMDLQTKALAAADEDDEVAEAQALTHEVERVKLLRRLERLRDETEAALLVKFPGNKELTRGVLAFEPERRGKKEEGEVVVTPG